MNALATRLGASRTFERLCSAPRAPTAVLVALMATCAAGLLYAGRGFVFYYDDWDFVINRRSWTLDTFLVPHNEHISILPIAVYKLLFATAGLDRYWVYRIVVTLFHLVAVALLYVLVRRRVSRWLAVAVVVPILFLGSAWEDVLWPFQIGIIGSVTFGLAMLLALELADRSGDVLAFLFLALSISCSSVGLPFVAAAFVEIVLRDRGWRRLWVPLVPLLLYAIWWVEYAPRELQGGGNPAHNVLKLPPYVADSAAGAVGGLTSLGIDWGRTLALLGAVFLVYRIVRGGGLTIRLWTVLATVLVFWSLSAIGRAQLGEPAASRYIYTGAILIVLIGVELARSAQPSARAGLLFAIAACAAAVGNVGYLGGGREQIRTFSHYVQASLAALELAGPSVAPDFRPDAVHAPNIYAGDYFDAVRQYGSPAESLAALANEQEPYREAADVTLIGALQIVPKPAGRTTPAGAPPGVDEPHWGTVEIAGACLTFTPTNAGAAIDAAVPGAGIVVTPAQSPTTPVQVSLRRFGGAFPPPSLLLPGDTRSVLRLPRGRAGGVPPWHVRLFATAPLRVCDLAR